MYLRPLLTDEMLKVQPKRLNGKSSIDACCFLSLFADLADLKTDVSHTFSNSLLPSSLHGALVV